MANIHVNYETYFLSHLWGVINIIYRSGQVRGLTGTFSSQSMKIVNKNKLALRHTVNNECNYSSRKFLNNITCWYI